MDVPVRARSGSAWWVTDWYFRQGVDLLRPMILASLIFQYSCNAGIRMHRKLHCNYGALRRQLAASHIKTIVLHLTNGYERDPERGTMITTQNDTTAV